MELLSLLIMLATVHIGLIYLEGTTSGGSALLGLIIYGMNILIAGLFLRSFFAELNKEKRKIKIAAAFNELEKEKEEKLNKVDNSLKEMMPLLRTLKPHATAVRTS